MSHWHKTTGKVFVSTGYLCIVYFYTVFTQYKRIPCVQTTFSFHRQYVYLSLHLRPAMSE